MCVALPGKVISIDGNTAQVDFSGNIVTSKTGLVKAQVGDYVLVHAGVMIQVLKEQDAALMFDILKDLDELSAGGSYGK